MIPQPSGRYNTGGDVLWNVCMRGLVKAGLILLLVRANCPCAELQGMRVENLAGSVAVRATPHEEASYRTTTPSGQKHPEYLRRGPSVSPKNCGGNS